ncbi:MAG: hypothetical protein N2C14_18150, partial [Planctomycetales bacterium]
EVLDEEDSLTVYRNLLVPERANATASTTLSVLHSSDNNQYCMTVYEDGRKLKFLSQPRIRRQPYYGYSRSTVVTPVFLFINSTGYTPDLTVLGPTVGNNLAGGAQAIRPDQMPERWIDYTSADVVCMSLDTAVLAAKNRRQQWQALRRWVASGGNLLIFGLGQKYESVPELETVLDLPHTKGDALQAWTDPSLMYRSARVDGYDDEYEQNYAYQYAVGNQWEDGPAPPAPLPEPDADSDDADGTTGEFPFLWRSLGMGTVVAFRAANPFPGHGATWGWFFNTLGTKRLRWGQRHGLSLSKRNSDFMDFLIPGVGLAPVTLFQVLITLFVVGIGPLNYWLLRRNHKLHLLLVTVPGSAALVTIGLFMYAMFADGFGTQVRARSLAHLDQRNGEEVVWSRTSYYAGLAPSDGLTFSENTAVYPIEHRIGGNSHNNRSVVWDGQQRLNRGWLPSRVPTQAMIIRADASDRKLEIVSGQGTSPTVSNHLGGRVSGL